MSDFSMHAARSRAIAAAWTVLAAGPVGAPAAAQADLDVAVEEDAPAAEPAPDPAEGPTGHEKANMANVIELYTAAFNDKNVERARFYVGEELIQHSPAAPDGVDGFETYVGDLLANAPERRRTVEAVFADGDFVILHARSHGDENEPEQAVVDIFRLDANGKAAEHWDVAQEIPAEPLNENGMFYDGETPPDPAPASPEQEAANREVAVEFHERALNRKDWAAASELIGPTYIQHTPNAADGPDGVRAHVEMLRADFPESRGDIQAAYVDGDRVILHTHVQRTPDDRGSAAVDIFRIAEGKVVEHWDVVQAIPAQAANDNGMFYE